MRDAAVKALRDNWDAAAIEDAQYHAVTIPGQPEEEFYRSGREEAGRAVQRLKELGFGCRRLAMDFGCGLGRVTVGLAAHFDRVIGVDVSGEMLARARKNPWVTYHRADSLEPFAAGSFDLVYTNITLQHMPGWLQRQYIREFFRLVSKDGAVMFELPDFDDMREVQQVLSMGGAPPETVAAWMTMAGGKPFAYDRTGSAGPSIPCYRYIATRA